MKVITKDVRLKILTKIAKESLGLQNNVKVFVGLITEEEWKMIRKDYDKMYNWIKAKGIKIREMKTKLKSRVHQLSKFFPNAAILVKTKKVRNRTLAPVNLIMEQGFKVKNFQKYRYVILIREEVLNDYGKKYHTFRFPGKKTDCFEMGLTHLLTHEFIHIVEHETGRNIYTEGEKDLKIVTTIMVKVLNELYDLYPEKFDRIFTEEVNRTD